MLLLLSACIFHTVFKDKNTPSPFIETFPNDDGEAAKAAKPDYIYMDAMGFGMGNCCLQVKCICFQGVTTHCLLSTLPFLRLVLCLLSLCSTDALYISVAKGEIKDQVVCLVF